MRKLLSRWDFSRDALFPDGTTKGHQVSSPTSDHSLLNFVIMEFSVILIG